MLVDEAALYLILLKRMSRLDDTDPVRQALSCAPGHHCASGESREANPEENVMKQADRKAPKASRPAMDAVALLKSDHREVEASSTRDD